MFVVSSICWLTRKDLHIQNVCVYICRESIYCNETLQKTAPKNGRFDGFFWVGGLEFHYNFLIFKV